MDTIKLISDGSPSINRLCLHSDVYDDHISTNVYLGVDMTIHYPNGRFYLTVTNFNTDSESTMYSVTESDISSVYVNGKKYITTLHGDESIYTMVNVEHDLDNDTLMGIRNGDEISLIIPTYDDDCNKHMCELSLRSNLCVERK